MGLGKTLQTIAVMALLRERGEGGPHLVIVPLSVLTSWVVELRRFCPALRVVRLHSGDARERERLRREVLSDVGAFDVVVTTCVRSPAAFFFFFSSPRAFLLFILIA